MFWIYLKNTLRSIFSSCLFLHAPLQLLLQGLAVWKPLYQIFNSMSWLQIIFSHMQLNCDLCNCFGILNSIFVLHHYFVIRQIHHSVTKQFRSLIVQSATTLIIPNYQQCVQIKWKTQCKFSRGQWNGEKMVNTSPARGRFDYCCSCSAPPALKKNWNPWQTGSIFACVCRCVRTHACFYSIISAFALPFSELWDR